MSQTGEEKLPSASFERNLSKEQIDDLKEKANAPIDIAEQAKGEIAKANLKFPHPKEECHNTCNSHLEIKERIVENCTSLVKKRKEIIGELESLKGEIKKHFEVTRTSKTGSTITGVVGSALLFTPLAPVGIGMIGAGTLTGLGMTINDVFKSKGYNQKIENIVSEETPFAKELQEDLKSLMEAAQKYAEESNCSFEEATARIISGMKEGTVSFQSGALVSKYKWSEFKGGLNFASSSLSGDKFGIAAKAGATALTKSLSIVGYAFDVVDCVNSWKSNHPSMDAIDRVVKDLESGIRELELLQIIFS